MASVLIIILIILLILLILWPPIIFFYLFIAIYPISLILIHKYGRYEPHWIFGRDPTSEIILYFRSPVQKTYKLNYWKINDKSSVQSNNESKIYISTEKTILIKDINEINTKEDLLNNSQFLHVFHIKNLSPNTSYSYNIVEEDTQKLIYNSKYAKFSTQNLNSKSFKFAVFGDFQMGEYLEIIETYLVYLIRKNNPDLLLSLGDNVHKFDNLKDWKTHNTLLRKLIPSIPFYTTPGNHDYGNDNGKVLSIDALMFPINENGNWYYSFKFQNVYFISMLSRRIFDDDFQKKQIKWLEYELKRINLLKKSGEIDWIIFFTHVPWWGPRYSAGTSNLKEEVFMRENWVPLFEKYEVDLFFAGHKHSYCRDGNKIITGSMHGVRQYPEDWKYARDPGEKVIKIGEENSHKEQNGKNKDYYLQNKHQFCLITVDQKRLRIEAKTWLNRNIEVYEILKNEAN